MNYKLGVTDIRLLPLCENGFYYVREGGKSRYVTDCQERHEIEPFRLTSAIKAGLFEDARAPEFSGFYSKWVPKKETPAAY